MKSPRSAVLKDDSLFRSITNLGHIYDHRRADPPGVFDPLVVDAVFIFEIYFRLAPELAK